MTNIEQKALALVNDCGGKHTYLKREWNPRYEALCRAIEQHEAFRQEVSDALLEYFDCQQNGSRSMFEVAEMRLHSFIIPAPKPDPLVEALHEVDTGPEWDSAEDYCNKVRASLDALGFEIREKDNE